MKKHRAFSSNASSSRAIPLKTQIEMLKQDIAYPEDWRYNEKGMQGSQRLSSEDVIRAREIWLAAAQDAIKYTEALGDLNVHKQTANRLLEPFMHISDIVTATDFTNFFALRIHDAAQPEIAILAERMYQEYINNKPQYLRQGEWHLPYVHRDCLFIFGGKDNDYIKVSVAKCARVSYLKHDNTTPTLSEDLALYNRLVGQTPIHSSSAEHCAMATGDPTIRSGNFRGWVQYRKTLKDENIRKFKSLNEIS